MNGWLVCRLSHCSVDSPVPGNLSCTALSGERQAVWLPTSRQRTVRLKTEQIRQGAGRQACSVLEGCC